MTHWRHPEPRGDIIFRNLWLALIVALAVGSIALLCWGIMG